MVFFRKSDKSEGECANTGQDLGDLRAAIEKAQLPETVAVQAAKELERLQKTEASTPEYSIGLNYIEYLLALPWNLSLIHI